MKPINGQRSWICSYCGKKLKADDDQLIDNRWAMFIVEIGKGSCVDSRSRVSCPVRYVARRCMRTFTRP